MLEWSMFDRLLGKHARKAGIERGDILFGSGLDMASISFAEFIMDVEEETGADIDLDSLDASIKTAGQLFDRLSTMI